MTKPRQLRVGEVRVGDTGVGDNAYTDVSPFFVSHRGQVAAIGDAGNVPALLYLRHGLPWYVNSDYLTGAMNLVEDEDS